MFERFTHTARATLFFARYETTELGGIEIEAEHILLGLLRADKGPTPLLFAVANLSYTDARATIRAHFGARQQVPTSVDLPFSHQTECILRNATEEADRLDDKYIGTGHLLLGILGEDGSFAAEMLKKHGMTIEDLREQMIEPPVVPEPGPDATEMSGVSVMGNAFDALVSLERIRFLAEELGRSQPHVEPMGRIVDEIHYQLDALKRHLAKSLNP